MMRRAGSERLRGAGRAAGRAGRAAGLAALVGLLGCMPLQTRMQSEEDVERYTLDTVGDKTTVGNPAPIPVGGVGLVVGLEGTGGDCKPDNNRAALEDALRKEGVQDIKKVLASPENALVIVSGVIPAGANKGDPIDLDVKLPRGSKATSLRGGYLHRCQLFNYDFAERLAPGDPNAPRGMLKGYPLVRAEGLLLVGLGEGDEDAGARSGRIWGGGRCVAPSPFNLVLNPGQQRAQVAALVADRINETFQAGCRGEPGTAVAVARSPEYVSLRVPPQYRLNKARFLRVVRFIPLSPDPRELDIPLAKGDTARSYRQRLSDDLLDPAHCLVAALRLEALGQASKPALKKGLQRPHPLVRFCAAEALAYLGDPVCGDELASAVARSPVLRSFGLTALASLDEAVCQVKLNELLTTAQEDETRYGAFRALRELNPHDPLVQGELLNESFWLHRLAPKTPPLVHVSTTRRAEIVVFGEEPMLRPDFSLLAGEFVVTASRDESQCHVSRVPLHGRPHRRDCPLDVVSVLRTLAKMGCSYPEAVALLQQAHTGGVLSCRLRHDALPQATTVEDLEQLGKTKGDPRAAEAELIPAGQDLGETPNLFANQLSARPAGRRQARLPE